MKIKIGLILILAMFFLGCTGAQKKVNEQKKQEVHEIVRGNNYLRINEYNKALNSYLKAYKINPYNTETLNQIGSIYGELGNRKDSMIYFQKAKSVNSKDSNTLYNISYIYYLEGDYKKAAENINAIAIEDQNHRILTLKAYIQLKLDMYQESYNTFNKLFKKAAPYQIEVYTKYIIVLKKLKLQKKIYPFLYNVYSKNFTNEAVVLMFADYFIKVHAYDKAQKILKKYGKDVEYQKNILLKLAKISYMRKKYKKAMIYLSLIKEVNQLDQDVLEFKITIYKKEKNSAKIKELKNILNNIKK